MDVHICVFRCTSVCVDLCAETERPAVEFSLNVTWPFIEVDGRDENSVVQRVRRDSNEGRGGEIN